MKDMSDLMVAATVGQAIEDVTGPIKDIQIDDVRLGTARNVEVLWANGLKHSVLYSASDPIQGLLEKFKAFYKAKAN